MKMKQLFKKRSILTLLLAAVMVAVFGMAVFAATSDQYVDTYDGNITAWWTFFLNNTETNVDILFSPTVTQPIAGENTPPSYFDDEDGAAAATYAVSLDTAPSLSAPTDVSLMPVQWDENEWLAWFTVTLPQDGSFGSLSLLLTNPSADVGGENHINATILRNEATPWQYTSAGPIEVRIYDPVSTDVPRAASGDYYYASGIVAQNIDFEEYQLRSFPAALDGTVNALLYTDINKNVTHYEILPTDQDPYYASAFGYFVNSLTIDGVEYPTKQDVEIGWLYRVYREGAELGKADLKAIVPLSSVVDSSSFMLRPDDVVVWRYGEYDDPDLFPQYLD